MTNELKESEIPACQPKPKGGTGWSPERRAAQSARMHARKPWLKSTGPRSAAGKRACKMNAMKHGHRSAQWRELSRLLRVQQLFVSRWRAGRYHPPKRRNLSLFNKTLITFPYTEPQNGEYIYVPRWPDPG